MPYNNVISRTDAAALIPEDVSNEILGHAPDQSAVLSLFRSVRMSRAQRRLPVLSALPVAYFVNGDTGLKQTTEVNWANKYLDAEELASIVPIPEAVLDDADFDAWSSIQPLLVEAVGRALDAAVFFDTNAPAVWPDAIVPAAVAAGNVRARGTSTAAQGGVAGDISEAISLMEADGYDPNGAVANRIYRGMLRNLRNTQGDKLPEVTPEAAFGTAIQYPMRGLFPTGVNAAEFIALDRDEFIVGIRQDITYKVLDQAVIQDNTGAIIYNLAQQDMVALRLVFRVAWQVANTINHDQPTEASRYPAAVVRSPAA